MTRSSSSRSSYTWLIPALASDSIAPLIIVHYTRSMRYYACTLTYYSEDYAIYRIAGKFGGNYIWRRFAIAKQNFIT